MVGCDTNKKTPFLSGADGVVSDFQQKIRIAARAYKEATRPFTNHPGAARHPSLKTEGNGAVSEPTHSLPFRPNYPVVKCRSRVGLATTATSSSGSTGFCT